MPISLFKHVQRSHVLWKLKIILAALQCNRSNESNRVSIWARPPQNEAVSYRMAIWLWNKKLIRTFFDKNLALLIRSRFFAKLFLRSNMCGTQESLSSTVVPSKQDLLTHSMATMPMWIGATEPMSRVLQISIASLFSECGVRRFRIRQSYNSPTALSNWATASSVVRLMQ